MLAGNEEWNLSKSDGVQNTKRNTTKNIPNKLKIDTSHYKSLTLVFKNFLMSMLTLLF